MAPALDVPRASPSVPGAGRRALRVPRTLKPGCRRHQRLPASRTGRVRELLQRHFIVTHRSSQGTGSVAHGDEKHKDTKKRGNPFNCSWKNTKTNKNQNKPKQTKTRAPCTRDGRGGRKPSCCLLIDRSSAPNPPFSSTLCERVGPLSRAGRSGVTPWQERVLGRAAGGPGSGPGSGVCLAAPAGSSRPS